MSVVVCTDLSGKESHRQIGMGSMAASCSLVIVMVSTLVSTLAQTARDVGSIPTLTSKYVISHIHHLYDNTFTHYSGIRLVTLLVHPYIPDIERCLLPFTHHA